MKINWIAVISVAAAILFGVLYFRTCNVPITSNTKIEDSLRKVAKTKDSLYKLQSDSSYHKLDSLAKHDSATVVKYDGVKLEVVAANNRAAALQVEIDRLRNSTDVDSLQQALADVSNEYFQTVALLNALAGAADSVNLAKDQKYAQAKALLDAAGIQIADLQQQRDAALLDDHSKDSVIDKLQAQKKANSLWAKIATVGFAVMTAITLLKH